MDLIKYILGELLFLANSQPPLTWRTDFYKLKDQILTTYADLEGHHLQHIFKECFNCNNGKVMKEVRMLGEWITMPAGRCPKCNGSGRYEEFWTVLESYRLGRRRFHKPIEKFYSKLNLPKLEFQESIEGYIRHDRPKHYLYEEAAFWLALFFDRKTFFRRFGRIGFCSRKFTPLVILSTWICELRLTGKRLRLQTDELKRKLTRFRQKLCRHEFPHTNIMPAWDECRHCGMKRMYVGIDRDPVPF